MRAPAKTSRVATVRTESSSHARDRALRVMRLPSRAAVPEVPGRSPRRSPLVSTWSRDERHAHFSGFASAFRGPVSRRCSARVETRDGGPVVKLVGVSSHEPQLIWTWFCQVGSTGGPREWVSLLVEEAAGSAAAGCTARLLRALAGPCSQTIVNVSDFGVELVAPATAFTATVWRPRRNRRLLDRRPAKVIRAAPACPRPGRHRFAACHSGDQAAASGAKQTRRAFREPLRACPVYPRMRICCQVMRAKLNVRSASWFLVFFDQRVSRLR
jgi:hypothetical protein